MKKTLFILTLLAIPVFVFADTTISNLPSKSSIGSSDLIPIVDMSGTPTTKNITFQNFENSINSIGAVTSITALSPLTGGTITGVGSIGCNTASGSLTGCLASSDWTTFNNKSTWATSSNSYWLSQQNLGSFFSTTSSNYWLTQQALVGFSTTSANYWDTQQARWATTSASYFLSQNQGPAFSTTSAKYFADASTTIPKTYSANTFNNTNTFSASQLNITGLTNGCLQIGSNQLTSTGSACGSGGGGGGGSSTWSTTTSNVTGRLVNYSNNNTDIVSVGSSATTSSKMFFDPNTNLSYFSNPSTASGTMMIGNALNGGKFAAQGFGSLIGGPASYYTPTVQISNNVNDMAGGIELANVNMGNYAATNIDFTNGASNVSGGVLGDTYYANIAYTGPNFNGTALGFTGVQPNALVTSNSDGPLEFAALSANPASSTMEWGIGPGYSTGNYDMVLKNISGNISSQANGGLGIGSTTPSALLSLTASTTAGYNIMDVNTVTNGIQNPSIFKITSTGSVIAGAYTAALTTATSTLTNLLVTGTADISNLILGPINLGVSSMLVGTSNSGTLSATSTPTASNYLATSTSVASVFPNASTTLLSIGNVNVTPYSYKSFTLATTTAWAGTTTPRLLEIGQGETWDALKCSTDVGTLTMGVNVNGTNYYFYASTTVGIQSPNFSVTSGATTTVSAGNPTSSPTQVVCTIKSHLNAINW